MELCIAAGLLILYGAGLDRVSKRGNYCRTTKKIKEPKKRKRKK